MTVKYFDVKKGITTGNITLDAANATIAGVTSANLGNTVTANFFIGSGNNLSNLQAANISGTVANATHSSTANTVVDGAQPNITSVGNLSNLTVTGNIGAGNVNGGNLVSANYLSGTLTTNAQPNITSVGTLSNLAVTGDGTFGNVFANSGTIGANLLTGTLTTSAQPNITSVGTLSNLAVTGNITAGNMYANSGTIGANLLTGTLTTAAQPNITSVGNLTGLTVNGNFTATNGNFTGNLGVTGTIYGNVQGNISGNIVVPGSNTQVLFNNNGNAGASANLTFNDATQVLTVSGSANVNALNATANVVAGNVYANSGTVGASLLTGTLTTNAQPNVTSLGTLSSLAVSGNATVGNLVGNVANGNSVISIPAANGNINLNAGGSATPELIVTTTGVNVNGTLNATGTGTIGGNLNVSGNAVISGNLTVDGNLVYVNVDTLAVEDPIIQLQTGPNGAAPTSNSGKDVGTALNYYDTQARVAFMGWDVSNVEFGLASQATISNEVVTFSTYGNLRVGTLLGAASLSTLAVSGTSNLGAVGNVTITGGTSGQFLQTNGSGGLSFASINTAAISNGNSNVNIPAANGNINLSVAGNANVVVVTGTGINVAGTGNFTGNVTAGNFITGSGSGGNISGANVVTANTFVGNVTGNIVGVLANGNSNVNIPAANGNINLSAAGNANILIVTGTGVNIAGTLNSTGNANVGNLGVAQVLATANVTAPTLISNVATGTAPLTVTSTTRVANLNVAYANVADFDAVSVATTGTFYPTFINGATAGNYAAQTNVAFTFNAATGAFNATLLGGTLTTAAQPNVTSLGTLSSLAVTGNVTAGNVYANSGTIGASLVAGTLTTAAQPNITSVGTLSSLTVTGNVTAGNMSASSGNITANVFVGNSITLGSGSGGNISNANVITANTFIGNLQGPLANGNSNVNIPAANGNINLSAAGTANVLVVTGTGVNVAGTLNATGNANVGNIGAAAGVFTTVTGTLTTAAQPNITSVGTLTSLAVTGNATAGNVYANSGTIGASLLTGTLTTAAQPNITSVGTLTSLSVTGNATAANFVGNFANGNSVISIPAANGNINLNAGGSSTPELVITTTGVNVNGTFNATGNANVGNIGAAAGVFTTVAGSLTTASQPNITSVGTLSNLDVTGNITAGNANLGNNVSANFFTGNGYYLTGINVANIGTVANANFAAYAGNVTVNSQPNITSVGTLTSLSVTGNVAAGNLTTTGVLSVTGNGQSSIAGNLAMNSNWVTGLSDPVNNQDAATKKYVDDVAQGLNIHDSCQAATPDTLANITGGTITYNNGSSGVGANLTTTGSFNLIDGVNVQTAGTRILVKNEANAVLNGIYTWSNATVITRATDYDSVPEVEAGDFVFVTGGTLYDNTGWVQTSSPAAIGTAGNTIDFTQFSGAGTYTAGTGLTLTGSQFSISNTTVTAASYGNGDSVATFTVNAQGQLTAAANVAITANAANLTGSTLNASIVTSSLTSVGTLGSLAVSGNATAGNVYANAGTIGASLLTGTLTTSAQPNVTSLGTLSSLSVSGNLSSGNANLGNLAIANFFSGNGSGLSSITAGNISGQVANALVAGTVYTNAQPNITSVGTLSSLAVSGNITSGNANLGNLVTANFYTGTLTTAAQPNITSVGTLTSLAVSGNATANYVGLTSGLTSNRSNVSISTNTVIDSFPTGTFRTAKYIISASGDDGYQSVETLLVHDGSNSFITIYGSICSNNTADIISLDSNISGGNVTVYATSSSANAKVNLVASYILT